MLGSLNSNLFEFKLVCVSLQKKRKKKEKTENPNQPKTQKLKPNPVAHFSHSSPTLFPRTGLLSLSHGPAPALAQTARASTALVHAAQPQRQPRSLTPRPSPAPRARLLSLPPGPARQISPLPPSAISARALCFASAALTPPLHCGPPRTAARLPYRARPTPSRSATSGPGSSRDPPSPRCNRRRDLRATPAGHARRD